MPVPVNTGGGFTITQIVKKVTGQAEADIQAMVDTEAGSLYLVKDMWFTASDTYILFTLTSLPS